jgi:hypothetical protein
VTASIFPVSLDQLRGGLRGRVVGPQDADYDELRAVLAGGYDLRPAAIVRVADAQDVAHVIRFAKAIDAELAIRGGGHSGAAHGTTDGGIVIDLRELRGTTIDAEARTAWADGGCTAVEVTTAAAEHGLAIGFGDTGSVGIGGITLGGGIGYLVRKHGMTIDSLIGAEIVTADGEIRTVDETHDPDLFWALRGGGGNFGVVTRFGFRLHPLDGVIGGMLIQPATPEVVARFMELAEGAPDELSVIANVMGCPPMPFVPEERHGEAVLFSLICWSGDGHEGEHVLGWIRALAEPIADLVKPIPYAEMFPPDEGYPEPPVVVGRTLFTDRIGLEEARSIIEAVDSSDAPMAAVQLRPLGGAMARIAPDATAFAHRDRRIMAIVVSFVEGPEARERRRSWVDALAADLDQGVEGAYVNFIDDGPEEVARAYPAATRERLAEIKARYDPTNLFRRNHNIAPAQ